MLRLPIPDSAAILETRFMKIQLASDLHLEYLQRNFPGERLIAPARDADLLVLAGDIASGVHAIRLFRDWPVPVLYVAGNHEFYQYSLEQTRLALRQAAEGGPVRFLDNGSAVFPGVRFLGATLWTDYLLESDSAPDQLMLYADQKVQDHHMIRTEAGRFTPALARAQHALSRQWLARELAKPCDGKTVVISHHGPHCRSIHPRFAGNDLNACFVSGGLEPLIAQADYWLHGHVHDSFDYMLHGCRIVANPRGYALNRREAATALELQFENPAFQSACLLDI